MSYTVLITEEVAANVVVTNQTYPITIEYNATNISDASSYGNAQVAAYLASGNNTGNITTTGNVSGAYILGNGSQLTGLPAGYSNATAASFLAAFGSNSISTTGNVTAGNISGTHLGSGAGLSSITGANVSGTVANAAYATLSGSATTAGTVTTNAQPNITSVGILSSLSVSGNVTSGNTATGALTVANDAVITGNLTVNGTTTTINSNTVTTNDLAIVLANNQSSSANINGAGIVAGSPAVASLLYSHANTAWESNVALIVTGNVTGSNLVTSGMVYTTQIEAVGDLDLNTSGRVNVNGNLRVGDNNTDTEITTHGAANLTLKTDNANSAQVTVRTGVNANVDIVPHGTGQTNITGAVSVTGNVTAAAFVGSGQYLSAIAGANVSGTVANATYATSAGSAGSATTAVTAGTVTTNAQPNITSVGTLSSLSVTGNVTTNSTSTVSTGDIAVQGQIYNPVGDNVTIENVYTTGYVVAAGNVQGNLLLGNTASVTGNVTGGNLITAGLITATGNVTGGNVATAGEVTATGNVTGGNVATAGIVSATGNVTGGNFTTVGIVSAIGNVTGGNIITAGQVSAVGNSTIANVALRSSGSNVVQITSAAGNLQANVAGVQPGRVLFGDGFDGNLVITGISQELGASRLATLDKITLPQTQTNPARVAGMSGQLSVDVAGSTWTNKRASGYRFDLQLGNGTINTANYNNIRAAAYNIMAGNSSPSNVGNVVMLTASGVTSAFQVGDNSRIGNSVAFISVGAIPGGTANMVANTQIGFGAMQSWTGTGTSTAGNVIGFYFNGTTNRYGLPATANATRQATNYYAFVNDDPIAQMQLGSIRSAHTYTGLLAAQSGTITIDKINGQTQMLEMTGNVTISSYANLVTTLSDGVNTRKQTDVLTILVAPSAYTLTLPTGAAYKYPGGNSTVPSSGTNWVRVEITATDYGGTVYMTEITDYT